MADKVFTYEYDGLVLKVTATANAITGGTDLSIVCIEGHCDINALYWGDNVFDGPSITSIVGGTKSDSSLSMNGASLDGEAVQFDGSQKVSSAGLGTAGTEKLTYIDDSAGNNTYTVTINVAWDSLDVLGIRATSASNLNPDGSLAGSIKGAAEGVIRPRPSP